MFGKMKIFLMITALFAVSFVYATQPWMGEEPYSVSEYCLLEEGNSVFGGIFTEFFNEETTGCVPFSEPIEDYIDFGETVYSLAGKGSVLAVGFYNRVEVYSMDGLSDWDLLFTKNVYGPVHDLAIDGDILYLAVENGVSKINLETEDYFHKHTYGTTKALRIHNNKLYVGDGQGVKKMNLDTLDIEDQRNTSGDVTKLEIMNGIIYTFEWAGLKRFNLSTLAPISTWGWNPYNPELRAYDGTLYAFGNNSVQKVTFNGSSVVRTAMTGDRVELRNNHTYNEVTFFPDGNGIRVSYLEEQEPSSDDYNNYMLANYNTVLGDQTESPYRVINLMAARDSLVAKGILQPGEVTDEDLAPTHYYVVFEPQDDDELTVLLQDEDLVLSEIPLDREILEPGIFYRDPNVLDDQPTYQYAVVEVGQQLPGVQFFILDHLILEPEDEEDMTTFFLIYFPMLEFEAVELLEIVRIPGWFPQGSLMIEDSVFKELDPANPYVGLANVLVGIYPIGESAFDAIRGGKMTVVETDSNGNFVSDRLFFSPGATYAFLWQVPGKIRIRSSEKTDASLMVTKSDKLPLIWKIKQSSDLKQHAYAAAYRAAHYYLNEPNYNIGSCFESKNLGIAVLDESGTTSHNRYRSRNYRIKIRNISDPDGGNFDTWGLTWTVIHELAHAHHHSFTTSNKDWVLSMSKRIKEAWAMAVDAFFTYGLYLDLNSGVNPLSEEKVAQRFYQDRSYTLDNFYWGWGNEMYTPILIDILEGSDLPYFDYYFNFSFPYGGRGVEWDQSERHGRCVIIDGKIHTSIWDENIQNLNLTLYDIKEKVKPRSSFKKLRNKIAEDFTPYMEEKIKKAFNQYRKGKNNRRSFFKECKPPK